MIDSVMISAFSAAAINDDAVPGYCNCELNYLSISLSEGAEASIFAMSLGSTNQFKDMSCDMFEPAFANIDNFKSEIYAALASKPKTISLDFLSKI